VCEFRDALRLLFGYQFEEFLPLLRQNLLGVSLVEYEKVVVTCFR